MSKNSNVPVSYETKSKIKELQVILGKKEVAMYKVQITANHISY